MAALTSYSKFYYGSTIHQDRNTFTFKEDGIEKVATLNVGYHLPSVLPNVLASALNIAGSQVYTVTFDRETRLLTISAENDFEIPLASMFEAESSCAEDIGFSQGTDLTGSNSYSGIAPACKEYAFQFPLQSYLPPEHNSEAIQAVKKKTVTGIVEAVSFGNLRKMEFEALYITDIVQDPKSIIRTNQDSTSQFLSFIEYATKLEKVEFMVDEKFPNDFRVFVLSSTEADQDGLGYKLIEEYDQGLPYYYRSGKLVFDLIGG